MTTRSRYIESMRPISFTPDSSWRAAFFPGQLDDEEAAIVLPVAGWAVVEHWTERCEEVERPDGTWESRRGIPRPQKPPYDRSVVAMVDDDLGGLQEVPEVSNFWRLLAPGEPDPSADDLRAALDRRKTLAQSHRAAPA